MRAIGTRLGRLPGNPAFDWWRLLAGAFLVALDKSFPDRDLWSLAQSRS